MLMENTIVLFFWVSIRSSGSSIEEFSSRYSKAPSLKASR